MVDGERDYEAEAKALGWHPESSYRGDKDKFVPAQEFVERGETLMPILKANNRKLMTEVSSVKGEVTQLKGLLEQSQQQIKELLEINTAATRKAAKDTTRELTVAVEEARKEGDTEKVVQLTEQLEDHKEAVAKATEAKPAPKTNGAEPHKPTDEEAAIFNQWKEENTWWDVDEDRTSLGVAMAQKLRQKGSALRGKAFFDAVGAEVERLLPSGGGRNGASKVESGRPSGGGGEGGGGTTKDFSALPTDAREAADRMMAKLKIQPGQPGSIFKDVKAYRQHYASKFFEEA